jgi:uncharacterized small protein (DUF1192 family)
MAKTITIGSKSITVTQLVVAIVLAVGAILGGFFGILKAEDRWNQKSNCYENALNTATLKKDMLAGFQQMYYQRDVKFEQERLTRLYDELRRAEGELSQRPNDPRLRQRINYLMQEIQRTKNNLQKLHEKKVQ